MNCVSETFLFDFYLQAALIWRKGKNLFQLHHSEWIFVSRLDLISRFIHVPRTSYIFIYFWFCLCVSSVSVDILWYFVSVWFPFALLILVENAADAWLWQKLLKCFSTVESVFLNVGCWNVDAGSPRSFMFPCQCLHSNHSLTCRLEPTPTANSLFYFSSTMSWAWSLNNLGLCLFCDVFKLSEWVDMSNTVLVEERGLSVTSCRCGRIDLLFNWKLHSSRPFVGGLPAATSVW